MDVPVRRVCATMAPTVATAAATDGASTVEQGSSSSPAFGPGDAKVASDPGSSPSSRSSTSSSLLGARSSSSNSARSPVTEGGDTASPKGHPVRRCLRRFARKLPRAGAESAADERPDGRRGRKSRAMKPDGRGAAVEDGTTREREEAVASAIAYCKESSRQRCRPPLAPSPSLDGWLLLDRPEEEIGTSTTSAASHCECEGPGTSILDAECGGGSPSSAETRRGPALELGEDDVFDGLDGDVLRITSYFAAKYVRRAIEE